MSHKQSQFASKLILSSVRYVSNSQILWVAPYYELRHLHHTNWRLKICMW